MSRAPALLKVLHGLLVAVIALSIGAGAVYADPKAGDKREKKPATNNPAWDEPVVRGTILDMYWVDGLQKGTKTPVAVIFSNESDLVVIIYGDHPSVRQAMVDGTACVGRFIDVGGERLSETEMSAQGVNFIDTGPACERTLV